MTSEQGGANAAPPTQDDAPDSAPARSWSQYSTWTKCPESWKLAKIDRRPRRPGVWFAAGSAFHSAVEDYLLARVEAS